jgi:hypothetical protein
MPFDSTGVYTPASGALSAAPGQVIASATWNAIFTDISNALTRLGQNQLIQGPRIVNGAGGITINVVDTTVFIQASVPTISLPAAATKPSPVTIVGNAAGIFSAHNSIIDPNGAETIDGLSTVTLTVDYQTVTLIPLATGGWVIR